MVHATEEYDRLGRKAFLDKYGFGKAKRYLLRHNGRLYDSKAIVGVAYGLEHPAQGTLDSETFNGGVGHGSAAWQLNQLGFEIVERSMA